MKYNSVININGYEISINAPAFFIADIASNHNGDLERAKELIWQAKSAGADAVKFQHFLADRIVSDYGFKHLGRSSGHQAAWKKSVYDVYKECECDRRWNEELAMTARKANVCFMTTPYDKEAVEVLDQYIPAYKIGSGDITWVEFISYIAQKSKPVLLATGASAMEDVERAVEMTLIDNKDIVLMQCNTNYTGNLGNFQYVNLNVLKTFAVRYPSMILGLSDHTPGHSTVLGAISLGARVIEKHFTIDNRLTGPDHAFSMNPLSWREMVERSRELESALGTGIKQIEENEKETAVLQRRCLRFRHEVKKGQIIAAADVECLRPAPLEAMMPYHLNDVVGKVILLDKEKGEIVKSEDLG